MFCAERSQDAPSYALEDLDSNCRLRQSISFGDIEELSKSVSDGARLEGRHVSPVHISKETPQLYTRQASYSSSMLFKPSTMRSSSAKGSVQAACKHVNTFPHLPHVPQEQDVAESAVVSPTNSLFSRLSFLSFTQTTSSSLSTGLNNAEEYHPHPLTRSISEAMLPSLDLKGATERSANSSSTQKRRCNQSAAARANSCAHPLTRFDFSDSECSTPSLSPRTHGAPATQPARRSVFSSQNWQDDTHLSVRTCELSDTPDSPSASPTSLSSFGSFFSGLLPLLTTTDASSREGSVSVDESQSLGACAASTSSSSAHPSSGCLSRPIMSEPFAFHISQEACKDSLQLESGNSSNAAPLKSSAYDVKLPSFPLHIAALPNSCAVDSFCMTEEELRQSVSGCSPVEEQSVESALASQNSNNGLELLGAFVKAEISGLSQGRNTSTAIQDAVPDKLLSQLIAILGNAPQNRAAQAASVQAATGAGMLCGNSDKGQGQPFEAVHTQSDKATGMIFKCERRPLRKNLYMWRTSFRIPNASIDTMQTYMLNDQIVRSSNAGMLAYVRLEDESLAATTSPGIHESVFDDKSATDSGFMYSKIKFPLIGARQYVSCRRVWHRTGGDGFYIVSTACQQPGIVSQAKALHCAKGLGDKAWSTDFWAGYMVRCDTIAFTCQLVLS